MVPGHIIDRSILSEAVFQKIILTPMLNRLPATIVTKFGLTCTEHFNNHGLELRICNDFVKWFWTSRERQGAELFDEWIHAKGAFVKDFKYNLR